MFKIFRVDVETQLNKKIKCIRSDHSGSTMADMMVQENNVQGHLLTRGMWNRPTVHHARLTQHEWCG